MDALELEATKVLVTGGTNGIGPAMVRDPARAGARVALTGHSAVRAREIAPGVPGVVGIELDVRDRAMLNGRGRTGRASTCWSTTPGSDAHRQPRLPARALGFWAVSPDRFRVVVDTDVDRILPHGQVTPACRPPLGAG